MNNLLYKEVYRYLHDFSPNQESMDACSAYMNTLCWCINTQVNMFVQKKQNVTAAAKHYYKIAGEANTPLKILITGEFKTGKSTLINTLLGKQILKSDVLPTTAVATYICYGEQEQLVVVLRDGTRWIYPLEQLKELTAEGNETFAEIRKNTEKVYLHLPLDFLRCVTLIDSPGINVDIGHHVEATKQTIEDVDMVFWVMSIAQAAKKGEIEEIRRLPKGLKPVVVFNAIDLVDPEEERVEDVLRSAEKRVEGLVQCCFGISAYQAMCALEEGNFEKFKKSNWREFLNYFLNTVCKQWYLWKTDAMKERWMACYEKEIAEHYAEHKRDYTELAKRVAKSSYGNWITQEDIAAKRKALEQTIPQAIKQEGLYDYSSGRIVVEEIPKMTSVMQCLGLLLQENQVVGALKHEETGRISLIYQNYQQQWYYVNYYMQLYQSNQEYGDLLKQSLTAMAVLNQAHWDEYKQWAKKINFSAEQYIRIHAKELEAYKMEKDKLEKLEIQLETLELYKDIKQQMDFYYPV